MPYAFLKTPSLAISLLDSLLKQICYKSGNFLLQDPAKGKKDFSSMQKYFEMSTFTGVLNVNFVEKQDWRL